MGQTLGLVNAFGLNAVHEGFDDLIRQRVAQASAERVAQQQAIENMFADRRIRVDEGKADQDRLKNLEDIRRFQLKYPGEQKLTAAQIAQAEAATAADRFKIDPVELAKAREREIEDEARKFQYVQAGEAVRAATKEQGDIADAQRRKEQALYESQLRRQEGGGGSASAKYITVDGRPYIPQPDGSLKPAPVTGSTLAPGDERIRNDALAVARGLATQKDFTPTDWGRIQAMLTSTGSEVANEAQNLQDKRIDETLALITSLKDPKRVKVKEQVVGSKLFEPAYWGGLTDQPMAGSDADAYLREVKSIGSKLTFANLDLLAALRPASNVDVGMVRNSVTTLNAANSVADFDRELERLETVLRDARGKRPKGVVGPGLQPHVETWGPRSGTGSVGALSGATSVTPVTSGATFGGSAPRVEQWGPRKGGG